jgi:hypothetical protein
MSTLEWAAMPRVGSIANSVLKRTAQLWFAVAVIGQLIFAFYTAAFYGGAAMRGDFASWNRFMTHGHVNGAPAHNLLVAVHLLSAVILTVGGAIQIIPKIRERAPRFHRWTGRLYMLTAVTTSVAGLIMLWTRGSVGDRTQHIGISINAILILVFAAMALRAAVARRIAVHRRWALRLFLVVSGVWFFRVGLFLSFVLYRGPFGFDPKTFSGPFLTFLAFGQYLVPLVVLELYFRAQRNRSAMARMATAAVLFVLSMGTAIGVFAISASRWLPAIVG